jgi:hypothetical protein
MANQKKGQKVGRNLKSGQNMAYKAEHRHEKGHVRRLKKHIKKQGVTKEVEVALIKFATAAGLNVLQDAQRFLKEAHKAA